jgi:hypothetical protein
VQPLGAVDEGKEAQTEYLDYVYQAPAFQDKPKPKQTVKNCHSENGYQVPTTGTPHYVA